MDEAHPGIPALAADAHGRWGEGEGGGLRGHRACAISSAVLIIFAEALS